MATAFAHKGQVRSGPVRFTADEFLRMEALGAFEGRKVELAQGVIVEEDLPGWTHARLQARLIILLSTVMRDALHVVTGELSVRISDHTVRDFDAGLTCPRAGDIAAIAPADVLLAVEIAVTSLATDLHIKALEYARVGIPVYWVVDAGAGVVHAMTEPGTFGYAKRAVVRFDEPLDVPGGGTITIGAI